MKTINITFTDKEFVQLLKAKNSKKGRVNWHHFIMGIVRLMKGGNDGKNNKLC